MLMDMPDVRPSAMGAVVRILTETNASARTSRFLLVHSSTRSHAYFPRILRSKMAEPNWHILTLAGAWRRGDEVVQVDWRDNRYRFRYGHDVTIPFYIPSPFMKRGLNLAKLSEEAYRREKDILLHMYVTPNNNQRLDLLDEFRAAFDAGITKDLSVDIRVQGVYGKGTDQESVIMSMERMHHATFCPVPPGIITGDQAPVRGHPFRVHPHSHLAHGGGLPHLAGGRGLLGDLDGQHERLDGVPREHAAVGGGPEAGAAPGGEDVVFVP
mmetsp:Transcript_42635/g.120444  ORF Transcript_42635/g.120444 Transcript_42635/m.120444 type:complete len:269 (+) Transcript_42635:1-807(+)